MTTIATTLAGTPLASSTTVDTAAATTDREKLSGVAKQFEAIFLRQMLAAARKSNFGDSMFSGQGMDTFRQMQDERFADIASDTGALGLGKMIEAHLARFVPAGAGEAATGADTTTKQEAPGDGI